MRRFLPAVFCIGLVWTLLTPLSSAGVTDPVPADRKTDNETVAISSKLQLARQLMSARDFQSAADILEVLYQEYPENTTVSNSLKSCYEYLKQYAKSEILLRRLIEQFPSSVGYKLNLAENLINQGKIDEGKAIYKTLFGEIDIRDEGTITNVVRSMIMAGLEEDALTTIDDLRKQANDSTMLSLERAGILEGRKNYGEAAREYVRVLPDTSRNGNFAEKKLAELLDFPESSKPTEKILIRNINSDSSGRALKILSTYYLKNGRYEEAYGYAIRQDSATGFNGRSLREYLNGCIERKLYDQAIRMCRYIMTNYQGKPLVNECYYRYAESLEELGQYDSAIAVYDTIVAILPGIRDKAEACSRIGRIEMERLDNPQLAIKYFDSVKTNYKSGFGYNYAVMALPQAYLQMGDLKNARSEYEKISKQRASGTTVEIADFNLALINFFEHNYDSTSAELKKLMVTFPKGFFVNDAVQLSFTIDQAEGAKDLLDNFSAALLFQQMKQYDSTVSRLTSIADADDKALADIALYRLTDLVMKRGDSASAIKFVERLENEFPDSYYLPYGLKTKADILLAKEKDSSKAKEIYFKLLQDYQNYPFINEVREKLRGLESPATPS